MGSVSRCFFSPIKVFFYIYLKNSKKVLYRSTHSWPLFLKMLQTLKRSRSVREPDAEPPVGYHYEGSPAQMIGGKLTVRLRRNVEGSRNVIYSDLYYADTELNETQTVKSAKYCCCISGCSKTIVMYVKPCRGWRRRWYWGGAPDSGGLGGMGWGEGRVRTIILGRIT